MIEVDSVVATLVDLIDDSGQIIPIGSRATVIAYAGDRLVISVFDWETDTRQTAECERWEVRRTGTVR